MAIKKSERILGAIHDTVHLATLPDDDCHVLFVDSQVLYLLQNFAEHEPNYIGRYIKAYYPGGMVQTLEPEDSEVALASDIARRFRLEVYPVTCDLTAVLEAINLSIRAIASRPCCGAGPGGSEFPAEPETGPPPIGPDEDFPDIPAFSQYKCQTAATIVYSLIQTNQLLLDQFPFGVAGLTIAAMGVALEYILAAAGLVALLTQLGAVAELITALLQGGGLDIANVVVRLNAMRDEMVCRLYCAANTTAAIAALGDLLDDDIVLSPNERVYIKLFFQNVIVNRLFTYQPDQLNLVLDPDCSECGCDDVPCGFIFTDQGVGGGFASGTFDYTGLEFTLSSTPDLDNVYHRIWFNTNPDCVSCPGNWCVQFVGSTLPVDNPDNYQRLVDCYSCDGETLIVRHKQFSGDAPPCPTDGQVLVMGGFYFNGPEPFEVRLKILARTGECSDNPDLAECI